MKDAKRLAEVVQKHRELLVAELELTKVLQELKGHELLTKRALRNIEGAASRQRQNEAFLQALLEAGPSAFQTFCDALVRTNQSRLEGLLRAESPAGSSGSLTNGVDSHGGSEDEKVRTPESPDDVEYSSARRRSSTASDNSGRYQTIQIPRDLSDLTGSTSSSLQITPIDEVYLEQSGDGSITPSSGRRSVFSENEVLRRDNLELQRQRDLLNREIQRLMDENRRVKEDRDGIRREKDKFCSKEYDAIEKLRELKDTYQQLKETYDTLRRKQNNVEFKARKNGKVNNELRRKLAKLEAKFKEMVRDATDRGVQTEHSEQDVFEQIKRSERKLRDSLDKQSRMETQMKESEAEKEKFRQTGNAKHRELLKAERKTKRQDDIIRALTREKTEMEERLKRMAAQVEYYRNECKKQKDKSIMRHDSHSRMIFTEASGIKFHQETNRSVLKPSNWHASHSGPHKSTHGHAHSAPAHGHTAPNSPPTQPRADTGAEPGKGSSPVDVTDDKTKSPSAKKSVRFSEHNETFHIDTPQSSPQVTHKQSGEAASAVTKPPVSAGQPKLSHSNSFTKPAVTSSNPYGRPATAAHQSGHSSVSPPGGASALNGIGAAKPATPSPGNPYGKSASAGSTPRTNMFSKPASASSASTIPGKGNGRLASKTSTVTSSGYGQNRPSTAATNGGTPKPSSAKNISSIQNRKGNG
ncbi:tropomyosin-1, isoforms 33/34-like [Branchiostoma lanceolatum]|uniref:tropomyosin-1, isoforms 33/34-like n=1 Tax=Branchiostoma lanceolatum TaxID=7740 RepID=UPI003454AA79